MKSKNICKFITDTSAIGLNIMCFVYESDMETVLAEKKEKANRAILIKSGEGRFIFDGGYLRFTAGDLIFTFSGENKVTESKGCEYMYISFEGARSEDLFRRFGINSRNRHFKGFDGMIPLWQDSLSRASESNIDLTAEGILLYTFSRLTVSNDSQSVLINKIVQITEDEFSDAETSISSIAEKLSYNSKYLSHLFKEKMGINYSEYLKNIRLKYAVTLLDSGVDSVKNVAALSGFSDALYFSSVFKKTLGVSPKEYTKRSKS